MADVRRIASLAMLDPSEEQLLRLQKDVGEILEMGRSMPHRCVTEQATAVPTDTLRADTAETFAHASELIGQSAKARDGYITVPRTVGGEV